MRLQTTKKWEKSHGHRRPARRSTHNSERPGQRAQEGRDLPNLLWPAPRPRPRLGRDGDVICSSTWRTASNTALMLVERLSTRSYWCTTGATAPAPKGGGREVRCAARDGEARPSHECLTAAPRWRRHVRAWQVLVLVCRWVLVCRCRTTGRIHGRRIYGRRGTVVVDHQAGCAERQRPRLATIVGPRAYRTSDTLASGARHARRHAGRRWRSLLA